MASPRVYIVLLNWNGWKDTIACLESLSRLDYANARWVVCDNASTDESMAQLRGWGMAAADRGALSMVEMSHDAALNGGDPNRDPMLALIQTGANLGFAGGCNVGAARSLRRRRHSAWLPRFGGPRRSTTRGAPGHRQCAASLRAPD